jgi:ATP-binding cassette subfamily A (ABC1) protein 3
MPNQELPAADEYRRKPDFASWDQYMKGGHTYMQSMFSNAILRNKTGSTSAYISMIYAPTKSSKYNDDDFATAANYLWGFFILLIFLAPLYRFVSNSVSEKENKTREAMKVMGLTDAPYWLSWFTYYIIINTIQC